MRRVLTVLAAAAVTLAVGLQGDANATVITLADAQIKLGQGPGPDQWVPFNTVGGTTTQTHSVNSHQFSTDFDATFSGTATAFWTLFLGTGLNPYLAASPGDQFALSFKNSDLNAWEFQVGVNTDSGFFVSGFTTLASGVTAILTTVPFALGVTQIDLVQLQVRGNVPIDLDDWNANFNVQPIPEPGSLILLGTGLSFLGLGRRKRQQ